MNNNQRILINFLKQNNIDAFVIPRNNEHFLQSPEEDNILKKFTNFTGSAGISIISQSGESFLFVDGRYTIQASEEAPEFKIIDITQNSLIEWINNKINGNIGLCPELHTTVFIKSIKQQHKLIPLETIKSLYNNEKTNYTEKNIISYKIKFAGQSSLDKRMQITSKIQKKEILLISDPLIICWILNIRSNDMQYTPIVFGYLILTKENEAHIFIDKHQISFNKNKKNITIHKKNELFNIIKNFSSMGYAILLDKDKVNHMISCFLDRNNIKTKIQKNFDIWKNIIKKTNSEIIASQKAHIYDGIALTKFLSWIKNNYKNTAISEESAAQKLYQYRKAHKQFISESFSTISAFGPNSSIIHYNRSKNHIIKDNIYLIDSGGHYFGATTDVTRTVSFGNPSEEQKFRYTLVLKSMIALSDAYFSENTTTSKLDEIARKNILNNGFDYGHGTSHGVGNYLCVHEPPHISKKNDEFNIHENIIISNEPGVYVENEYGIRIENLMYTIKNNNKINFKHLTCVPFEYQLIKQSMLSDKEKKSINNYNKFVKSNLEKYLNDIEKDFLYQNTKLIL